MTFPVLRLELESMRHSICHAFTEYAASMDQQVQTAVKEYCTPENLQRVINAVARQELDRVLKEEIEKFFRYGEGRKAVAAAVKQSIMNNETFTPLDE